MRHRRPPSSPALFAAFALLAALLLPRAAPALEMDFVSVGDPGNPDDDELMRCCDEQSQSGDESDVYGSVPYVYRIGRYEVTVAQWTEFLNAVAAGDPNELWSPFMGETKRDFIRRSGSPGSFSYTVSPGQGQKAVAYIRFFDALRFANWLHNGQPVGPQGPGTTEDGAYTLTGFESPVDVVRNPDAKYAVPTQDEWYKAAYYDPVSDDYFLYPTGEDVFPDPVPPPGSPDVPAGNFCPEDQDPPVLFCPDDPLGPDETTEVGAYIHSPSPWGTFDQGGNHNEWNEEVVNADAADPLDVKRGFRGGNFARGYGDLQSSVADALEFRQIGALGKTSFRVAALPEPGAAAGALAALGALALLSRRSPSRVAG